MRISERAVAELMEGKSETEKETIMELVNKLNSAPKEALAEMERKKIGIRISIGKRLAKEKRERERTPMITAEEIKAIEEGRKEGRKVGKRISMKHGKWKIYKKPQAQ